MDPQKPYITPKGTKSIHGEKKMELHQEEPTHCCKNTTPSDRPCNHGRVYEGNQGN